MGINLDRKLLALVAADMVGFSRLIESNEIEILQRQKQHLIKVLETVLLQLLRALLMLLSVAFRYNQKLITWREYIIRTIGYGIVLVLM
jgi:class 3 adenylate cyclase